MSIRHVIPSERVELNRFVHWMLTVIFLSLLGSKVFAAGAQQIIPSANSTWVYDIRRLATGKRRYDPGYHATALNTYNRHAGKGHKIRMIYSYAGSLEMYCQGRDAKRCRQEDLTVVYPLRNDRNLIGFDGPGTLQSYKKKLDSSLAGGRIIVVPVIDGVESANYAGSLKGFNELSREMAYAFADKVSRKLCGDDRVAGVQFDIEPFNVSSKNGQYYFYKRIAENLSGETKTSSEGKTVSCRNELHPRGKFFSVFGSSNQLNPAGPAAGNIAEIMNAHNNGYFIAPLYDLGSGPVGQAHSVTEYQRIATRHAKQMAEWASKLNVMYQLGIPAAATVHEHGFCRGKKCRAAPDSREQTQEAYTKAALDAVDKSGSRSNSLFRGVAVWGWTRGISVGGSTFEPQVPNWNSLELMKSRL